MVFEVIRLFEVIWRDEIDRRGFIIRVVNIDRIGGERGFL